MIDEVEGAEGAEDQGVVDGAEPQEQVAPDPIEDFAQQHGWKPRTDWKDGDKPFVDAKQFLADRVNRSADFRREFKGLKEQVTRMGSTSAALAQQAAAERDAYWEGQIRQGVEAGDYAAVSQAQQQRMENARQAQQFVPPVALPPEAQEFAERHAAWFRKDEEATRFALGRAEEYAQQGLSPARQIMAVERDMRHQFPDLMPVERNAAKPPATVAAPNSRTSSASSRKKGYADLPPDARRAADDFFESRGVSREKYAETYFAQA